jgi:ATP-binding protein involved in chromosome partitioning
MGLLRSFLSRNDLKVSVIELSVLSQISEFKKIRRFYMNISENNSERGSPQKNDKRVYQKMADAFSSSVKHTFLVMSNQGKVGKTSVIMMLAQVLSKKMGMRVGLLDINYNNPNIHILAGCESENADYPGKRILPRSCSENLKVASVKSLIKDRQEAGTGKDEVTISDVQQFILNVEWGALDYLFVDTPPGPEYELIPTFQNFPGAEIIIVTSPNRISMERSKEMVGFYNKLEMPFFGWIENKQGFLCQKCDQCEPLFETGPPSRAIFLQELSFLGQIPVDPYLEVSSDTIDGFLKQYPDSEAAEGCERVVEKILTKLSGGFVEDRAEYEEYFR